MTPSDDYRKVWQAIRERRQITCIFEGKYREACPIILGYSADGRERTLVYQVGGQTSAGSNLPGWRSFFVAGMCDLKLRSGPWTEGASHSRAQSHIQFVDVDVNIAATLWRQAPLPFGSRELQPPRK